MAARSLGEYLKNDQRAVVDGKAKEFFEVALLRWTQCLIEQHFAGIGHFSQLLDLFGLAAAYEQRRVRRTALTNQSMTNLKACGLSQQAQFSQLAVKVRFAKIDPNQNSDRQPL
jgi:hypothetical protein